MKHLLIGMALCGGLIMENPCATFAQSKGVESNIKTSWGFFFRLILKM